MKPNGWQRLWIVFSAIWIALIAIGFITNEQSTQSPLPYMFAALAIPALTYLAGLSFVWIIKGFKNK